MMLSELIRSTEDMDAESLVKTFAEVLCLRGLSKGDVERVWPRVGGKAAVIAESLSPGAKLTLCELITLCPKTYDTTGVSKFGKVTEKTARKFLEGELRVHELVGRRESYDRLGLFPTALARDVHKLLTSD